MPGRADGSEWLRARGKVDRPGVAIELSLVQVVNSIPPLAESICSRAYPFSVQSLVEVLRISKVV